MMLVSSNFFSIIKISQEKLMLGLAILRVLKGTKCMFKLTELMLVLAILRVL